MQAFAINEGNKPMTIFIPSREIERKWPRSRLIKKVHGIKASRKIQFAVRDRLVGMLSAMHENTGSMLGNMGKSLTPFQISRLLDEMHRRGTDIFSDKTDRLVNEWIRKISEDTKARFERDIANAFGFDFTHILDDANIREAIELENIYAAHLIKTIPDEYIDQVQHAVLLDFQQKPLPEGRSLREQIQHIYGVSEARAGVIPLRWEIN